MNYSNTLKKLGEKVQQIAAIYVTSVGFLDDANFIDKNTIAPDKSVEIAETSRNLKIAMKLIPEQDQQIIKMYYFDDLTLQEIGSKFSLSKSWVCRKHAQAISRLSIAFKKLTTN